MFVVELARLDAHLAAAEKRRSWLMERIEAGDPAAPTAAAPRPVKSSAVGTQKLLLGLGGLLLSLAGLFFTAVAWTVLSPVGKVAVLAAIGGGFFVIGYRLRRRLTAAAETLAAAGLSLVATATYAAPAMGAVGHGWSGTDHLLYVMAGSGALVVVYAATAAWSALRAPVAATAAAVLVTATSAGFYTVARTGDPLGFTAVTALAATVVALVVVALRGSRVHVLAGRWGTGRLRRQVGDLTAGVVTLLLVAAVGSLQTWIEDSHRVGAYALASAGFAVLAGVLRWAHPQRMGLAPASMSAGAFGAAALVLLLAGQPTVIGPSLACIALGAGLLVWATHVRLPGAGRALTNQGVGGARLVAGLLLAAGRGGSAARAAILSAAVVLTVGGLTVPGVVGAPLSADRMAWYLLLGALGLLTAGCTPQPMTLNRRGQLVWAGGAAAVGAWLIFIAQRVPAVPERLETFTAPAAALLVGCGLLWAVLARRRHGVRLGSVPALLPGLSVLMVPGAVLGMDVAYDGTGDPALLRSLVFGCGGAVLLVLGARVRVAALVVAGTAAVGLSTLGHLIAFGQQVPQWVALAASGLLLLMVGMRWEWLRTHQATAQSWVGNLR